MCNGVVDNYWFTKPYNKIPPCCHFSLKKKLGNFLIPIILVFHHLSVHGRVGFSFQLNCLDRLGFHSQIIHDFLVGLENIKYLRKQTQ